MDPKIRKDDTYNDECNSQLIEHGGQIPQSELCENCKTYSLNDFERLK